jgi:methylated-DNA-[protein]-cysteine S-methyltransferase
VDELERRAQASQAVIALFSHPTPAGEVRIASRAGKVVGLSFLDSWERTERHLLRRFPDEKHRDGAGQGEAERQLEAYLAGDLDALTGLPVDAGGTSFQQRVWAAIRAVPAGRTLPYGELARAAGSPTAVRAAGTACGANPIGLLIPCHRIVRADGELGNYGSGIERKKWLLTHERGYAATLAAIASDSS